MPTGRTGFVGIGYEDKSLTIYSHLATYFILFTTGQLNGFTSMALANGIELEINGSKTFPNRARYVPKMRPSIAPSFRARDCVGG